MWFKWTKRILASLGILIILIIAFFLTVVYIYEDEVKQYAVEQLNKNLKAKVETSEIELTLWDQFPKASLRFSNVFIPDYLSPEGKDTMFYAKHIYLSFDFWDMMEGNYKVQTVDFEEAKINLFINQKGEENYDIYKSDTTDTSDSKFKFELKSVSGDNVSINYLDSTSDQHYKMYTDHINFSGNFNEAVYDLAVKSDLRIKKLRASGVNYISNKKADVDLAMKIDNNAKLYHITKGDINIEEILFAVTGKYANRQDSSHIDLDINGKNIDLASAFTILPEQYAKPLEKYKAKGLVVFDAKIAGPINEKQSPKTTAEFYIKEGSLTELNSMVSMTKLSLDGYYSSNNGKTSVLEIKNINGNIDVGSIAGNVLVEDLSNPKISVNSNGSINLKQLKDFVNSPNIEQLSGMTNYNLSITAQSQPNGYEVTKSVGNFDFANASLKLPTSALTYSQMNGKLILYQNDAAISDFKGFIVDSDFRLDGAIKNLIPYIFNSEEILTIEADLRTERLVLDQILAEEETSAGQFHDVVEPEPFILPSNIHLNLKSQIENMYYGKFDASAISGIITLDNKKLTAKNFSFTANGGTYLCNTNILQNPDNTFDWSAKLNATDVDIENFFQEMDNFGQTYLTDENIKGKGDISLNMGVVLNNDFSIVTESLIAETDLHISKGQLVNQASMLEIGEYFNENKLVKAIIDTEKLQKKLANIKFSDLRNTITIKNEKIFIPKMTIETNVLDLNLSGSHGFNDSIDYHFSFVMRKLFYVNKKQEEFGPVVDDGLGGTLFLHMFGHLDDPQYEIDSEEKHEAIKQNIQDEKEDVKSLLKTELGLFRKDSTVGVYEQPQKVEPTFEVEWEEFDEKAPKEENSFLPVDKQADEKKKKDKGINKLLKKLGVEEEKKDSKVELELEQ